MIIEGEKWACEACVRGHRVSNCQHSDRPLQHINKKGRPVSQCHHCRSMRKSRASHVKCDCGEKTHKCAHLQATVEGHRDSCCCNHGGRCTCSHKKELPHLDPVPESESDGERAPKSKAASPKATVRRRRANTTNSDGTLTFDENGHHRPTYKHSRASQKSVPYQLKRVNSLHSSGGLSNHSADSLLQSESRSNKDSPVGSRVAQEPRRVKSETASPLLSASSFGQLNSQLPPLDLSAIEYPPYVSNGFDMFSTASENDQGLFSAGLSGASVDWSHYDLEFSTNRTADNFAPSNYSQPQSFGGYDFNGSEQAPTLTTTTSGEASEAEDFIGTSLDDLDSGAFATGNTTSSYSMNAARPSMINQTDLSGSLDFDNLRYMKAGNKFLPTPASLAGEEPSLLSVTGTNTFSFGEDDSSLWMNDYSHGLPNMRDSPAPFWDTQ